jgi:ribosomal protein S18 acetylase RimI-like enzyme
MHIRTATLADAEDISAIARETFALACPPDTPAVELQSYIDEHLTAAAFETILDAGRCEVRILWGDSKTIGFSLVDPAPDPLGIPDVDNVPELTRCYVRRDYHGKGAAQILLSATLESFSTSVRLMVNDKNTRAIRFYARNGFVPVGETYFKCGADTHRDIVMLRKID